MIIVDELNKIYKWFYNNIWSIVGAVFVGLVVHFQLYANALTQGDGNINWGEYVAGGWELSLGRWGLRYIDNLSGNLTSPVLATFLTLIFFSIAGILFCELLDVHNKLSRFFIALFIVCSPFAAMNISYYFCSDAYSLAFLLAILSVLVSVKGKFKLLSLFCGSFVLAFSLGCYQSNIGVAAVAGIMYIINYIWNNPDKIKEALYKCFRVLATGISGAVIYYLILKIFLSVHHISMSDYKGADNISIFYIMSNLSKGIKHAYLDFISFFHDSNIYIMINSYGIKNIYCILFLCFVLCLLLIFFNLRRKPVANLLILLSVCLIPLMANLIDIMAPDTSINFLTAGGMYLIVPFIFLIICQSLNLVHSINIKIFLKSGICFILFCAIWQFTLINTADSMMMQISQNKIKTLSNRIYYSLEQDDRFTPNSDVIIVGAPEHGNYPFPSFLLGKTNLYSNYGIIWGGGYLSYNGWSTFLYQYLGINVLADLDYYKMVELYNSISETETFKTMPIYPDRDSIQIINDVFVVKISDVQ